MRITEAFISGRDGTGTARGCLIALVLSWRLFFWLLLCAALCCAGDDPGSVLLNTYLWVYLLWVCLRHPAKHVELLPLKGCILRSVVVQDRMHGGWAPGTGNMCGQHSSPLVDHRGECRLAAASLHWVMPSH